MSTVSSVDTAAVLEAFMNVVPDLLADGKIVDLGDFGTFRVSVSSEGADNPEDVTSRSITNVRILFQPGKRFRVSAERHGFEKSRGIVFNLKITPASEWFPNHLR